VRIVIAEPYYGGSHKAWADGYQRYSRHDVAILSHPGRWWKWRMQGAAVTLAGALCRQAKADRSPDLILATDMLDVAAFRGLLDPHLRSVPTALYMHESQLTYPESAGARDLTYAMVNWRSALAADAVLFNSGFHLDEFFAALPRLLGRFPDQVHGHLIEEVRAKSQVLPVGVDLGWAHPVGDSRRSGPPLVVWNHRWEEEKGFPEFRHAVDRVVADLDFRLAVCGAPPVRVDDETQRWLARHAARLVHAGRAGMGAYRSLLCSADVVVSAAHQEFFGVSVVEGIAAGAFPVLPRRLSYPWLIPAEFHSLVLYEGDLAVAMGEAIGRGVHSPERLRWAMRRFEWPTLARVYDDLLEGFASP